jgi:GTP-binding nuclear protein Ran
MRYFEVFAKSNYHYEMPFLSLARQLINDPNLAFTTQAVLLPPEAVPLPEDNNDFLA